MKKTAWLIIFLFLAVSCLDDPDCFRLNNNFVGIAFRVMGSSRLDSVALKAVSIDGKFSPQIDTSFYTNFESPVNYFNSESRLLFHGYDRIRQLNLGYQVQTQFVSEDCGPRYVLSDLKILEHDFEADSIRIVNSTPSRSGGRHIEIFRCPKADTIGISFKQLTFSPTVTTQTSRFTGTDLNSILVDHAVPLYVDTRATTVHLPVNTNSSSTQYSFDFADNYGGSETPKTISISYTSTPETRFRQCGEQNIITGIIPQSDFDSIRITRDADDVLRNRLFDPIETNLEVFKCPQTNIVQLLLRRLVNTTRRNDTLAINGIRTDYNDIVYYQDTTVTLIRLPLNLNATSTTFTIDYEDGALQDLTFTINYTITTRRFYGNRCGGSQRAITALTTTLNAEAGSTSPILNVSNSTVQFPPVNNIEIVN